METLFDFYEDFSLSPGFSFIYLSFILVCFINPAPLIDWQEIEYLEFIVIS